MPAAAPTLAVWAGPKTAEYVALFRTAAPDIHAVAADDITDPSGIEWLAGWRLPLGYFARFPQLNVFFGLGAGVDAVLMRDDLAPHVQVVKLADAGMAPQMAEFALMGVLHWQRRMSEYSQQQAACEWKPLRPRLRADVRVSVLGLGAIGGEVARTLADFGYRVSGWSRSQKSIAGVRCMQGADALRSLLTDTNVLVNMLPSTPETRGLINHEVLAALPVSAYVVNGSRGDQLDVEALLKLLDSGHLSGALLDVFATEPLPADSPLWRHANIRITPHVAAATLPAEAVTQIVANIRRVARGEKALGAVQRQRGY
ncbi:MAG: glyoxylate/hydroxypyruvate reductase A [Betaproteobacteria bacterium]|nr:glyoxylate/hydroxypyruvate reductase A [Betaproteobacteria bacterium]